MKFGVIFEKKKLSAIFLEVRFYFDAQQKKNAPCEFTLMHEKVLHRVRVYKISQDI
jgi:hypothetical protein